MEKMKTTIFFIFSCSLSWCTLFFLSMLFSWRKLRNKIAFFGFFQKSQNMSHGNGSSAFVFQVMGILKPVTVSTDKGLQLSHSPMVGCNSLYGSNIFPYDLFCLAAPSDKITPLWSRWAKWAGCILRRASFFWVEKLGGVGGPGLAVCHMPRAYIFFVNKINVWGFIPCQGCVVVESREGFDHILLHPEENPI